MAKTIKVGGMPYGPDEVWALRDEVIAIRDENLGKGAFREAVVLSHAIGVLTATSELLREGNDG